MQNEQLRPEWYHWIVLLQPNVEGFHLNIKSTPGFRGPTVKLHGLSWVRRCALPGWSVGLFSQSFQSPQNPYGSEMSRTSFYQDFPILLNSYFGISFIIFSCLMIEARLNQQPGVYFWINIDPSLFATYVIPSTFQNCHKKSMNINIKPYKICI